MRQIFPIFDRVSIRYFKVERRESKCCAVLMKHGHKVKGEQVLILQMDQQLKTKNISDVSGQLLETD